MTKSRKNQNARREGKLWVFGNIGVDTIKQGKMTQKIRKDEQENFSKLSFVAEDSPKG